MLLASRLFCPWDRIIEPATKFVDAPGKGPLAFITSLVLISAVLTHKFLVRTPPRYASERGCVTDDFLVSLLGSLGLSISGETWRIRTYGNSRMQLK